MKNINLELERVKGNNNWQETVLEFSQKSQNLGVALDNFLGSGDNFGELGRVSDLLLLLFLIAQ